MSALVSSGCATAGQRTSTLMSNSPGVLRVATSVPAPGFCTGTNADAVTGGFEDAMAQELARRFNLQLEIVDVPFEQTCCISSG